MALVKCSDCGRDVSDKAPACPQCGAPMAAGAQPSQATTIQATSKTLKLHILIASLLFWGGLGVFVFAATTLSRRDASTVSPYAMLSLVGGAVWYAGARFLIWWHHE